MFIFYRKNGHDLFFYEKRLEKKLVPSIQDFINILKMLIGIAFLSAKYS